MERPILNNSRPGEIVADCFAGSGTTLIAAERTRRIGYMAEIHPPYCDIILQRWEMLTGRKAQRLDRFPQH